MNVPLGVPLPSPRRRFTFCPLVTGSSSRSSRKTLWRTTGPPYPWKEVNNEQVRRSRGCGYRGRFRNWTGACPRTS